MNISILGYVLILSASLAGCATQPPQPPEIDRISPEQLAALVPPAQSKLSLQEIADMSKQGKTDAEVIDAIKQSDSRYVLTAKDVLDWHQKGISIPVLDYIQQANKLAEQNAIADEINKREKARVESETRLKRERDAARLQMMNPWFYGPGYYGPWGSPYWGGGGYWGGGWRRW